MNYASILSAMENIEEYTVTTGNCKNFESTVVCLLPKYLVAKYRNNSNKRNQSHISDTSSQVQCFGSKVGIENTGVSFI